jgi:hypothetical protein
MLSHKAFRQRILGLKWLHRRPSLGRTAPRILPIPGNESAPAAAQSRSTGTTAMSVVQAEKDLIDTCSASHDNQIRLPG